MKVLQIAGLAPDLQRDLSQLCDLSVLNKQDNREHFLATRGAEFEVVVTNGGKGCSAELMRQLPNLRIILGWGVGYDKVDLAEATRRGIRVANTPDVLNECVADMAIAMILCQARRLLVSSRALAAGDWAAKGTTPLGTKVSGKRLGIVGLGRIGLETAKRAAAFNMDIRYHNRRPRSDVDYPYEASLEALARWCDYLVLLCPGGPETDGLISAGVLRALGPESVLVNIARGSVVDESALVSALLQGELGGAALDVFANEPNFPEELLALPNVVMFPHIGSATVETREAMSQLVLDNLKAYLAHDELLTPVN